MSRQVQWQRTSSDGVSWHQDQALNATIYILREVGPTSFLLKEDGETKKFKVSLGDPHVCGCPTFKKEKIPCKHICWVLLKKFKLDRRDELSYQLGLVEREINQVLRNPNKNRVTSEQHPPIKQNTTNTPENGERVELEQRSLTHDDVCPICQERLLAKHLPVTFCRYGCGNSVHIKCMKVWVDHQRQSTGTNTILCPFCREDFGSQSTLAQEYKTTLQETRLQTLMLTHHLGVNCDGCGMTPIKGKCYRCATCEAFHLCNTCYHGNQHVHHSFVFRLKKAQRWRSAPLRCSSTNHGLATLSSPVIDELQSREITDADYDVLLQLDGSNQSSTDPVDLAGLPEHLINKIPMLRVKPGSRLLAPGRQCRVCLRAYSVGEFVRRLPGCGHSFHRSCIDEWLSGDHRRCPVDRRLVFDPTSDPLTSGAQKEPDNHSHGEVESKLVVPGVGLIHRSSRRKETKSTTAVRPNLRPAFIPKRSKVSLSPAKLNDVTINDLLVQADVFGVNRFRKSSQTDNDLEMNSNHRNAGIMSGRPEMNEQHNRGSHNERAEDTIRGEVKHSTDAFNDSSLAVNGTRFRKSSFGIAAPLGRTSETPGSSGKAGERALKSDDYKDFLLVSASRRSNERTNLYAYPYHAGEELCQGKDRDISPDTVTLPDPGPASRSSHGEDTTSTLTHSKLRTTESEKSRKVPKRRERERTRIPDVNLWELTQDGKVVLTMPDVIEGLSGVHLSRNLSPKQETTNILNQERTSRWCSSAPVMTRHIKHS